MKTIFRLSVLALFAFLISGCKNKETVFQNIDMLKGGKTIAVPSGTVADQFVLKRLPDAKIIYLNDALDCALAVKNGAADAAAYDKPILQNIAAKNGGLNVLPELLADDQYGFAFRMEDTLLKSAADEVIKSLKNNGLDQQMMERWFPAKGLPGAMPEINLSGTDGVLRFGTSAVTEPMSFIDANHQISGFDIELAGYIAQKLNKKLEIIDMKFDAMLPALISGKVDMVGAGLSITEERAKKVLFTTPYYIGGIAVLVKSADQEETAAVAAESQDLGGLDDLKTSRIAVLMGSVHDAWAVKNYKEAKVLQYQTISDMLNALNADKADVALYDHASVRQVLKKNPNLGILVENVFTVPIAAGFNQADDPLRESYNAFLAEMKATGVYQEMVGRWMDRGLDSMPVIETPNRNGVLRAGIVSDLGMPFSLIKDGNVIGFDIEFGKRFARYLGKAYEPVDMPFGSLLASISTKKIDIITSSLMVTEERKKQIDFSDPYYECGVSILAQAARIKPAGEAKLKILDDIGDKRVGIFTGTVHDAFIEKKYPQAQIFRFESTADMMMSLKSDKIDAAMFDLITARLIMKHNPDLGLLSDQVLDMPLGVGFNKNNPELLKDFNAFLKEIRADGTYKQLEKRWFEEDAEEAVMPEFPEISTGKKVVAGVSVEDLPYVAYMNGKYVGFDIEMLRLYAQRRKLQLEIVPMEFPSLVAALAAGKVDLITDGIAISEERAKEINFSDSYATFRTAVIAPKSSLPGFEQNSAPVEKISFFKKVGQSFYNNILLEKRYLLIINGLIVTVIISIFAAIFGSLLGGLICFMRMSKNKLLSGFASGYISLLRGTPVLVLLMIIYYVVFASVNINPVIVAVIAFGLNFAAYVSEMFRTSIGSVDKGQWEAGIAGGFTKVQTFRNIVMPQALRHVLPVYKGEFISLVKMTSIVGYIAVQDLTKAGDIIRSRTFDAFFPLIMAAVIYLFIAWLLTRALDYVEVSADPKRNRKTRKQEAAL